MFFYGGGGIFKVLSIQACPKHGHELFYFFPLQVIDTLFTREPERSLLFLERSHIHY